MLSCFAIKQRNQTKWFFEIKIKIFYIKLSWIIMLVYIHSYVETVENLSLRYRKRRKWLLWLNFKVYDTTD